MKKFVMLAIIGVITIGELVTSPGVALAYVPYGYRGHSYYRTPFECHVRGRRGLSAREWAFYQCHDDGWDVPQFRSHLVVSAQCTLCIRGGEPSGAGDGGDPPDRAAAAVGIELELDRAPFAHELHGAAGMKWARQRVR